MTRLDAKELREKSSTSHCLKQYPCHSKAVVADPICVTARARDRLTLEALTRQVGKNVILSQAFADLVKGDVELEGVGEFPVRGFSEPVELFAYGG